MRRGLTSTSRRSSERTRPHTRLFRDDESAYYRELSNGHFTDDNHKMLSGVGLDVPVYEAKMTRDTRLVVSATQLIPLLKVHIM